MFRTSQQAHGLFEARRAGRLVGAVVAESHAGRAGIIYPPQLVEGEPSSTRTELLQAAVEYLREAGACIAHLLAPVRIPDHEQAFEQLGFCFLAVLHYLVCQQDRFPRTKPASDVEFYPFADTPEDHRRLCRVIEATYEGTLDCPELSGVRAIDEVVAGYRATGVFSPDRWLFVRHRGEDVGCLLLTDHPRQNLWELVYMGLVPAVRGRGWGRQVIAQALWLAHRAGRDRVVAAVDAANTPALRAYTEAGFQCWDRRFAYQKVLS